MKNKLWFYITTLLLLAHLHASEDTDQAAKRFREMLKTVDRVVLEQTHEPSFPEYTPEGPLPEINDTAVIASLGNIIEFEQFDPACACEHTPEINFYQGKKLLFTLTLFEHRNLRCIDGPWSGDAVMTESSAVRFRAWFAEHGYIGFVREYDTLANLSKERAEQDERFISRFPESVRPVLDSAGFQSFPSKTDINITKAAASFPSKKDLVLTCWRALGEIKTWNWDINDAHASFAKAVLTLASEQDIRAALDILPDNDAHAWAGAYRHFIDDSRTPNAASQRAIDDAWFAQLVKRAYKDSDASGRTMIICDLREHQRPISLQLLLDIAQLKSPFESDDQPAETENGYTYSHQSFALFTLAKLKVKEARDLTVHALTKSKTPGDTAALQVALALYDGSKSILPEHFNHDALGIADAAWTILSSQPDFLPSLDLLANAAKSKSRWVRFKAEALLRKYTLRPLTPDEELADVLKQPHFTSAQSLQEIDRLIAQTRSDASSNTNVPKRTLVESLYHHRARLLLSAGSFDEARADLKKAGYAPDTAIDRAFVEQTLGHFNEAAIVLSGSLPEEKAAKKVSAYFEHRGYLCLARAKFEDAAFAFQAARSLPSNSCTLLLFHALSLVLAGKQEQLKIDEYELGSDLALWPYNGLRMIQGRTTEAEVINQIQASYRKDSEDLCEAHFVISALRRVKDDAIGEREHLLAALATKRYTSRSFSLATVRLRELETLATAKP